MKNDKESPTIKNECVASYYKCSRCGEQADVFVGLNDPDATDYAMCRDCAKKWKAQIIFSLGELHNEIRSYEKR